MSESKKDLIINNYDNIKKWLKDGLFEKQIYNNLGMGKTTWSKWKKELLELQDILSNGNDTQIQEVRNSTYEMATGYDYTEEVAVKCKETYHDKNGKKCTRETLQTVTVKKHQPAKGDIARWWLTNRDYENWKLNPHETDRKKKEFKERMEHEKEKDF